MIEVEVRKIGDSFAVILPNDVAERLHTSDGDRLLLIEAGDGDYRLAAGDRAGFEAKMAKADDIMRRYTNTLDALAK